MASTLRFLLTACSLVLAPAACDRTPPPGSSSQSPSSTVRAKPSALPAAPAVTTAPPGATSSSVVPPAPVLAPAVAASPEFRELTWSYDGTEVGDMRAVVVIPAHASESNRLPVVIAMHGQGEALKGPDKGARGWIDDYGLPRALRRILAPPLTARDLRGRADPARLAVLNASLERQPYRGVILVCSYTPHKVLKGDRAFQDAGLLADFFVKTLLPRVYSETPAIGTPATTGIDGVSLGGRASVLVALERPEAFGVLGALQPAFDSEDAPELARKAKAARARNPNLRIRLLTSDGDYYLASTTAISEAMNEAGVPNTLTVVQGDHSYDFNRGPGVYELLLLHDRALRGEPIL